MQQEIWFHKYRIIKLLGRGGSAKVYLVEHINLNSFRAIKCINKNHPLYDLQRKEAQILKNLKHSCIPIIYDIEEDEEGSYIVEQYLEGATLKDYVGTKDRLTEDIIIRFALQLCDLIHYLHSLNRPVLYLDLKPENIIVMNTALKLIDFGSAIYQDELKADQAFFGTKGYAAPELYKQDKIDERCDVYGIGMLLYYMATGIEISHDLTDIVNIDLSSNCSKKLKAIINHCLKYNPSQRYDSVSSLSKQLSAIIQKNQLHLEKNQAYKIAIAGAQPRIGVTHLSFHLCYSFMHQKIRCLYQEKNNSQCVWNIRNRYDEMINQDGVLRIEGITMLPKERTDLSDILRYNVLVQDFGSLTKENLFEFLDAEIRILVLGAKDWELPHAEQALNMVAEYKDVIYMFNYLDGKQFQRVMKSMKRRKCYRIPYEPNPFAKPKERNGLEFFQEIIRLIKSRKGRS